MVNSFRSLDLPDLAWRTDRKERYTVSGTLASVSSICSVSSAGKRKDRTWYTGRQRYVLPFAAFSDPGCNLKYVETRVDFTLLKTDTA